MTKYKLTYFDFDGGRGEPIRIAFHAAGIEFEDNRLSFAEFGEMRRSTRFSALPVLEIDGAEVTQSNAISRYVGKLAGWGSPRMLCIAWYQPSA
jgi:glutathione S-transferase